MSGLNDIGIALVRERRALGVSQRELAERLGTSQQQVARWEASEYRTARLERVAAVAAVLGVTATPSAGLTGLHLAAEDSAAYASASSDTMTVTAVRDLGEVAARLREHYLELRDAYGFERIGVFGSFACGEQSPGSDVDVVVELREGEYLAWLGASATAFLEEILGRKVDLVEPDSIRERIRERVLREAIYVWEA